MDMVAGVLFLVLSCFLVSLTLSEPIYNGDQADDEKQVTIAVLRPKPDDQNNFNSKMGAGAIIAMDFINTHQPLRDGYKLVPSWYMPGCDDAESLNQVVKAAMKLSPRTHGFIGPECSKSVESIALLARGWNIAMISYGASTPTVSDHERYQTFARSIPPYNTMGHALAQLLLHYKWNKHICILTSVEDIWLRTAEKFKTALEDEGIDQIYMRYIFPVELSAHDHQDQNNEKDFDPDDRIVEILKGLKTLARIVILLTYNDTKVLSYANTLGLMTGDYVFIVVEGNADYLKENVDEAKSSEILTGLFSITYRPLDSSTPQYGEFVQQIKEASTRLPETEEDSHLPPPTDPEEIIYEAFIHDAVILYARGLNDTLEAYSEKLEDKEFDLDNPLGFGKMVRDEISDLVIEGISGTLNMSGGDRRSDFLIQNYQNGDLVSAFLHLQNNDSFLSLHPVVFAGGSTEVPDPCGKNGELCETFDTREKIIIIACTTTFTAILFVICLGLLIWKIRHRRKMLRRTWEIKLNDVMFYNDSLTNGKAAQGMSAISLPSVASFNVTYNSFANRAHVKNKIVFLKRTQKQHLTLNNKIMKECQQLWEARNANITEFIGVCISPENIFIATAFCSKRSLMDILNDDRIQLDLMFKMALATDLVKGLMYIHRSPILYHGNLTSSNCLVDDHWTLKITDFGIRIFRRTLGDNTLKSGTALLEAKLWRAPEYLNTPKHTGSQTGDIYSVGIVLQEIICEDCPYPNCHYSTQEIIEKVPFGFRPKITHQHASPSFVDLVERCWEDDPTKRISLSEIKNILYQLNPDRRISLTDRMLKMMDKYTNQLEVLVEERTVQLAEERDRADQLLYSMLPKAVAEKLKVGQHVPPEAFESASIYFSDIVGFTDLSKASTPFQVVDLLNDLYTVFDELVDKFDCYKVETIGDAYMVVSGIPQRNGHQHSAEIAAMALQFLEAIKMFKVRHRPADKLKLRIGLHTGSCAAGVVGLKMPRYCLFGDTVNTASRMESTGLPSMIHTSQFFYDHLNNNGRFVFEERGEISIKGKGTMRTYFLTGKKDDSAQLKSTLENPLLVPNGLHIPYVRPRTLTPLPGPVKVIDQEAVRPSKAESESSLVRVTISGVENIEPVPVCT